MSNTITQATTERTWTFVDKSAWHEGEWSVEADKYSWTDPTTDLPCLIVRNSLGSLCGYVGVDESHPLFEVSCPDELVCHEGITFSDFCTEGDQERGICHIPEPGKPDRVWWLGFDCGRFCDICPAVMSLEMLEIYEDWGKASYKNVAYVKEQVASLALQLHNLR